MIKICYNEIQFDESGDRMKFKDMPYERPNLEEVLSQGNAHVERIEQAESAQAGIEAIRAFQALQNTLETQGTLSSIRHSIDTKDAFYEAENDFWDENQPYLTEVVTAYYRAVLNSPYRAAFEKELPKTFFMIAENSLSVFDPKVIPLLQKENKLSSEYGKLIASAEIEYKGETYNLSGLSPFTQSTDRQERKTVMELIGNFFSSNQDQFDRIYDDLVKTRDQMAKELGFKDFVEMGYVRMNRFDYDREDVKVYRQEVLKHVVPVVNKLYQRQADRLDLAELKYYDIPITYKDGNAIPKGSADDIVKSGRQMYHEMSEETGEFIDFMFDNELMDLVTKPGKAGGGYCTYIPDYKSPFIFSNFNGTSDDIDVLTHEAGHAFQVYESRWITTSEVVFPTYESCEIHSMSMEFFAWPWMELFFEEQTPKYKYSHLADALTFLPYGVLVDHYQHEVYENPNMTPEERRATWRRLEKEYNPWKDYDGNPFYEEGGYWFRQGHIFSSPFYYIDYTLAQVCAFQFWKRSQVDNDPNAWSDYLAICKVGGTLPFGEIVELANLKSPFGENNLKEVIEEIDRYLSNISEDTLVN